LIQLGFTNTQAKIYLTLIETGETEARILAKEANISNQVTYRTLDELIAKGIVEKKLSTPIKYQAIPLEAIVDLVLNLKADEYTSALEKTKKLLSQYSQHNSVHRKKQEHYISVVEGKDAIINRCREAHARSLVSVDVCTTFQRLIHIDRETNETVQNALERGVFYRVIVEQPDEKIFLSEDLKKIVTKKNFQLKIKADTIKIRTAIYDKKICGFSLYSTKDIGKSPMIWTNHHSIITGFQEYFKKIWNETKKLTIRC
jgi:sugar-specific transcriptional regulator TrmB